VTAKKYARAELPIELFEDQDAWAAWLESNHADSPGLWLRHAKKASDLASVSYAVSMSPQLIRQMYSPHHGCGGALWKRLHSATPM